MSSTAIIAGATGLVGGECLRLAVDRYDSVVAILRRPIEFTHARLEQRVIDFDKIGSIEIPAGAHVYCALGTTIKKAGSQEAFRKVDFDYPRALAQRAAGAGDCRFMLVSSVGASARSAAFYLRIKGELEDAIRAMPLAASVIFRPSFILGDRGEKYRGQRLGIAIAPVIGPFLIGGLRKYRAIESKQVAAAMIAAANSDARGSFVYHYDEIVRLASR